MLTNTDRERMEKIKNVSCRECRDDIWWLLAKIEELERENAQFTAGLRCFSCGVTYSPETAKQQCDQAHREEWGHEWVSQRVTDLTSALFAERTSHSLPWVPNVEGGEKPEEYEWVAIRRVPYFGMGINEWASATWDADARNWIDESHSYVTADSEVSHWLRITPPEGRSDGTR